MKSASASSAEAPSKASSPLSSIVLNWKIKYEINIFNPIWKYFSNFDHAQGLWSHVKIFKINCPQVLSQLYLICYTFNSILSFYKQQRLALFGNIVHLISTYQTSIFVCHYIKLHQIILKICFLTIWWTSFYLKIFMNIAKRNLNSNKSCSEISKCSMYS